MKGIKLLVKEVASVGKHNNDLIGHALIPLKVRVQYVEQSNWFHNSEINFSGIRQASTSTPCPKKIVPFFFLFFPRCPVCGEWCKLHWLLLDTPSFDWNTCRSLGHKMFKMAPTKQQKAFCAVEYAKTTSGAFAFA